MRKGFTLLELIVVVIILGVLAAVGVPQYFAAVERGRSSEAVSLLSLLRGAQMRRYAEEASFAADLAHLDITYTVPKFFTMAVPTTAPAYTEGAIIATATRNTFQRPIGYGGYILRIEVDGDVTCTGGDTGACARLGY